MAKKPPTKQEKEHMGMVASLPCLVCRGRSTVHHVTGYADRIGRIPRSHQRVVPLCNVHHQIIWGPRESVEALGHRGFFYTYGIDLYAEACRLWEESQ